MTGEAVPDLRVDSPSVTYDPDFLRATNRLLERVGEVEVPDQVTVAWLRKTGDLTLPVYGELAGTHPDVRFTPYSVARQDGSTLALRWYTKKGSTTEAAAVYVHGGGMVMADLCVFDPIIARYVSQSGTPLLAVEYGLAPENPYPRGLDDCVAAVRWLRDNAERLGVRQDRIGIMGDSGGGGLAAGAALYCRDHGVPLASQILIYPMLDDRTREPDPLLVPFAAWTYENNAAAWDAVLGEDTVDVSPYAAPGRATDLTGLPRTYLDTGELDIFRAEILDYATRLSAAGVPIELHVHPGVAHAFELTAPHLDVSRRALADRSRALRSF